MSKYLLIFTFLLLPALSFAEGDIGEADDLTLGSPEATEPIIVAKLGLNSSNPIISETRSNFVITKIEFATESYYQEQDGPSYKPKNTIIVGGVLPFVPIKSTIDETQATDDGLLQKSVSFLLYVKQKF